MVDPKLLCRNHLLGEHNELHKHRHNFVKHHKIDGRISPIVLIEPTSMKTRHDQLVDEMLRRGYNHESPYELPDLSYLPDVQVNAKVNIEHNLHDLMNRCPQCRQLIKENEMSNAHPKYILTVDWCSKGNRGIFAGRDGNCFWRDDRPHTADEMFEILGVFDLILAPESTLFTEEEMKQYHKFIPLAEYTNQYGIVVKDAA